METLGSTSTNHRKLLSDEAAQSFEDWDGPLPQKISNFHVDLNYTPLDAGLILLALLWLFVFSVSSIFLIAYCIVHCGGRGSQAAEDNAAELQVPYRDGRLRSTRGVVTSVSVRSHNILPRLPQDRVPHSADFESNLRSSSSLPRHGASPSSSSSIPGHEHESVDTTPSSASSSASRPDPFEELWNNIEVALARSFKEVQNSLWGPNQIIQMSPNSLRRQNKEPQTRMTELQLCEEALKAADFVETASDSNFSTSSEINDVPTDKVPISEHEEQSSSRTSGPDVGSPELECCTFEGSEPSLGPTSRSVRLARHEQFQPEPGTISSIVSRPEFMGSGPARVTRSRSVPRARFEWFVPAVITRSSSLPRFGFQDFNSHYQ